MNRIAKPVFILGIIAAILVACLALVPTPVTGDLRYWVVFAGEFHPLFLHLPIGAVMLAVSMEVGRILSRGRWQPQTTWVVFFAAATAIPAAILGYSAYAALKSPSVNLEEHMRDGIIFTVCIILVFLVKFWADLSKKKMLERVYVGFLFLTTLVLTIAAHHGGEETHGDPLDKFPPTVKAKEIELKEAAEKAKLALQANTNPHLYKEVIVPIFQSKCYDCHNEEVSKGGLKMHTWEDLLAGDILDLKNPENGMLLEFIHLPMDDSEHMPPEEEPQLSPVELEVVTWWVKNGHDTENKIDDLNFPSELKAKLLGEAAKPKVAKKGKVKIDWDAVHAAQDKVKSAMASLNEAIPNAVKFESQQTSAIIFSAVNMRKKFTSSHFSKLTELASNIKELDLSATSVDDSIASSLENFTNVVKVKLNETMVTDTICDTLAKLDKLESINLYGTAVTDKGLEKLAKLENLKHLHLWGSKVTKQAVEQFRSKRPEVEITGF